MNDSPKEMKMPKRISLEEADNGFVVSTHETDGEKRMVAKDMHEAMGMMEEMMGAKAKAMPAPAVMRVGKRMR